MLKKYLVKSLLISAIVLPAVSFATGLTIVNNTNHDSTSIINKGACSTILGQSGITRAHSTNTVDESTINFACFLNKTNCKAEVYMTANCSGPIIATAVFDTKKGIKSVTVHDESYKFNGKDFRMEVSGGPN